MGKKAPLSSGRFFHGLPSISHRRYQVGHPVHNNGHVSSHSISRFFLICCSACLLVWIESLHACTSIQYIHSSMPCNSRPVEGANDPRSILVNSNLGYFFPYFWATAHRPRRSLRSSFSFFSRCWADRGLPCAIGGLLPPAASLSLPSLPSISSIQLPSATNPERDV